MQLIDVVRGLAQALHLPELQPGADGSGAFRVHGIPVLLLPRPEGEQAFVARSRLGSLEGADAVSLLPQLMVANFFADGVGGAALSLDARGDVYLTQHFSEASAGFAHVLASLERFAAQARRCRDLLPAPTSFPLTEGHA